MTIATAAPSVQAVFDALSPPFAAGRFASASLGACA